MPEFEGVTQFCQRVGIGRTHLYNLLSAGKLTARKVGRRTLIDVQSGLEYFRAAPVARINCAATVQRAA